MDKTYDPANIEQRWYQWWERENLFAPSGKGEPYCIMLPPPNVTGSLHIGHAFQDTIMDLLIRYHRMLGHDTLWQCGTDHAGIATQMVVERQLAAQGKHRRELGREAFVEAVWTWKQESGGTITDQMRRLGASVDWASERFTMDEGLSRAVTEVFVRLFDEGLIYRGKRLVNWDPVLHTALSDLEVVNEEEDGHLWWIRYPRVDGGGHVLVATTRPETLLGDTAVAVHPQDHRHNDLIGSEVELPLTGRRIPVIGDDHVDPEFGSGCVKITPAHDFNDWEMGRRHNLPVINIFNDNAEINDNAPEALRGLDRFAARERVVEALRQASLLESVNTHRHAVPRGDRTGEVLEPYLTDQWFVRVKPLAETGIEAVRSGRIEFIPENWARTYYDWMDNIQDWCISRQLWWGHRIPAWYDPDGNIHVGHDEADARRRSGLDDSVALQRDEDVLDTWFSSALWPFSTLGWPEDTDRLQRFYPTSVLVTGFDIIFFWVARMIMLGLKFVGDVPFRQVYIHGLIRDGHGRKMSKSKGNVLDPLDLIQGVDLETLVAKRTRGLMQPQMAATIEQATRQEFPDGIPAFGADPLRFTFAAIATRGHDMSLDLGRIHGYRNFCNKLWNAARFVLSHAEGADDVVGAPTVVDRWIRSRLHVTTATVHEQFADYRLDLAAHALYEFTWSEFCDWYLELSKPMLGEDADPAQRAATRRTLLEVLETLLRLLHPIMPFITEEIWQRLREHLALEQRSLMIRPYPEGGDRDPEAEAEVAWLQTIIQAVRSVRTELDLAPGKPMPVLLQGGDDHDRERCRRYQTWLARLARVESVRWLDEGEQPDQCAAAVAGNLRLLIPLTGLVDIEAEIERLQRRIGKKEQELEQVSSKLDNRRFLDNAPQEVVAKQRRRHAQLEQELAQLGEQRDRLRGMR